MARRPGPPSWPSFATARATLSARRWCGFPPCRCCATAARASPFVLRVYAAWTPEGWKVMPGGFCRTSERLDVRAISMGEDARTADVWVIDDKPVERMTLMASKEEVKVRRILGHLPSRAADNLFWLGRYLERAEATLRLARSLCTSLMDSETALHTTGETLACLQKLLIEWGALDEEALGSAPRRRP
uniref:Alpha-E domain-containing protein n=1 Tax=Phenylobacterium glaciei TaxID=2803784 RepID=A0A974P608_9CAUL|nr:alpha-E domain-containing protein [Phenylobacterium glaciei]